MKGVLKIMAVILAGILLFMALGNISMKNHTGSLTPPVSENGTEQTATPNPSLTDSTLVTENMSTPTDTTPDNTTGNSMPDPTPTISPTVSPPPTYIENGGMIKAEYIGVSGFGDDTYLTTEKLKRKHIFLIDGSLTELLLGGDNFAMQNILKVGYKFNLKIENDTVVEVLPVEYEGTEFSSPVSPVPGEKSIKNLLTTALLPVGNVLYVYGGGWSWQDDGASVEASSIGMTDSWIRFFNSQNKEYSYRDKNNVKDGYYPHGGINKYYFAGLDCSGYVGWTVYNTVNTENGREGYVTTSTKLAKSLYERGWGSFYDKVTFTENGSLLLPGDVVSIDGHVWMCLGKCEDGSVVILHSTPSESRNGNKGGGVQLSAIGNDKECQAYLLADHYMKTYYPVWYERYPVILKSFDSYLNFKNGKGGVFSWSTEGESPFMSDEENVRSMTADDILKLLFNEISE